MPRDCDSYTDYIDRIETNLIRDLRKEYPQIEIYEDDSAADVLETIFEECDQQRFVFVLDEWDFIFHKDFVTEENKKQYVLFLSNLLKDRSYVQLTYMTGILPIAMYSSGSELNMFWEYTMVSEAKYNEYFGFTDFEVKEILKYKPEAVCVNGNVFSTYPVVHALRKKHVPVLTIIENDEEKLIVRIPSGS